MTSLQRVVQKRTHENERQKRDNDGEKRRGEAISFREERLNQAETFASRGDADKAFEWLEKAYLQRDGGLPSIKGNPNLRTLEHDPRYAPFMQKMKLPLRRSCLTFYGRNRKDYSIYWHGRNERKPKDRR
jgi:hypothetical protein